MSEIKFCEQCHNLMTLKVGKDKNIVYYCELCDLVEKAETNILKSRKKQTIEKHAEMAETALYDDTLPRIKKKCKSCDNDILIYFKDTETLRNVYVCRACSRYWV